MFEAVIDSECDSTGLASHFGVADFDGGGDGDLIGRVYLDTLRRMPKAELGLTCLAGDHVRRRSVSFWAESHNLLGNVWPRVDLRTLEAADEVSEDEADKASSTEEEAATFAARRGATMDGRLLSQPLLESLNRRKASNLAIRSFSSLVVIRSTDDRVLVCLSEAFSECRDSDSSFAVVEEGSSVAVTLGASFSETFSTNKLFGPS